MICALTRNCSFLLLLFALFIIHCEAQEITFRHIRYDTENGLPSTEVYETHQDSKGYMWFCTDAGVSRFNGYEFENFTTNDGLTDNTVFHIYEDGSGRIWFLPYNGRLCYFDNGQIHPFAYNRQLKQALPDEWVKDISIDAHGNMVLAGRRYGFIAISKNGDLQKKHPDPGNVSFYRAKKELIIYSALKTGEDNHNFDLFLGDTICYASNRDKDLNIYQYLISDNEFLFGIGGNVCHYNGHLRTTLLDVKLNSAHIDNQGRLWLALYDRGIQIYRNIDAFFSGEAALRHLYSDKNVSDIYKDKTGAIWLAVQNSGVYYLPNPDVEVFKLGQDELTNRVSELYMDEHQNSYACSFGGKVFRLSTSRIPSAVSERRQETRQLIQELRFRQNTKWKRPAYLDVLLRDGRYLWEARANGLWRMSESDTVIYHESLRFNTVFKDQMGTIWAGSNDGLFRYTKKGLESMAGATPLFAFRVEDIDQLDDGTLLFATKGKGLVSWDQKGIRTITREDGLTNDLLRDIFIDADQEIWISTPTGLNHLVRNATGEYSIQQITEKHGLPGIEVNGTIVWKNIVWVATNSGVAKFNKHHLKRNLTPPRLSIDEITINEEPLNKEMSYDFPHSKNSLAISFTGMSYRNCGHVKYRYRMTGIDDSWIETTSRTVRYPSLAPGNYTLEVQAANEDGVWSKAEIMQFVIHPPFWKTLWFATLIVLLILVGVFLLFRMREKRREKKAEHTRMLEQQKLIAVRAELKALRAQMNPHFTFNTLSAIQTAVNDSDPEKASEYIVNFAHLIRKVLENSRHRRIKLNEEIEMLHLYVGLEQLRFSNKFEYSIEVDPNLDTDYVEIPSMVIQPYVENAIIHGLASKKGKGRLMIRMTLEKDNLLCVVEDNGIGRENAMKIKASKNLKRDSMAMSITEDRMELYRTELGEEFSLKITDLKDETGNPSGTRVELTFPAL